MRSVSEIRQLLDELESKTASERGELGLSNAEIRQITHLDLIQVIRLTRELMKETNQINLSGKGRYASYEYKSVK